MNKIQICNLLITRRCNLKCDYCRIVKNYNNKPPEYPDMKHYIQNEMPTEVIIEGLRRLKLHNENIFILIYGGEPLLRSDLSDIINYCNNNDIHYTIISNNTEKTQPLMKELFEKVDYIEGFTASIDPIIFDTSKTVSHIFKKSIEGIQKLSEYKQIKDRVAEITVTNENLQYLYILVKVLTDSGINSDITFVDISKSPYYDFSDVEDSDILVTKSERLKDIFNSIIFDNFNVHMRDTLLAEMYKYLPSEYDCKLDEDFHNLCIDADGSIRLCLRIRGIATPYNFNLANILNHDGNLNPEINKIIQYDKNKYCLKCNHSCYMMSKMISNSSEKISNLIHSEIRSYITGGQNGK